MLHCYSRKIAVHHALLLKQLTAGGADPDNLEYAGALMQRSLLEVAHAADDLVTIFGAKQVGGWVGGVGRGCGGWVGLGWVRLGCGEGRAGEAPQERLDRTGRG